jgi:TPR repeat protein
LEQNDALVVVWWKKAAEGGDAHSQYNLGLSYMHGLNGLPKVGRCRLTLSKGIPVLKAPMVSALKTRLSQTAFNACFQFPLAPLHQGRGVRKVLHDGRRRAKFSRAIPEGLKLLPASAATHCIDAHLMHIAVSNRM